MTSKTCFISYLTSDAVKDYWNTKLSSASLEPDCFGINKQLNLGALVITTGPVLGARFLYYICTYLRY